jgi:AcrR family transcriptional regulator
MKSKNSAPPDSDFSPQEIQIIEAFLSFCINEGIENVTQQKIAKKAKIALATLQYYFGKGKPSLTSSALRWVAKTGQGFTSRQLQNESAKPGYQPLYAYFQITFAWAKDHPTHASFWLYSHYLASIESEYGDLHAGFFQGGRRRIESLLYEQFGRQGKAPPKNPAELAARIHTLLHGSVIVGIVDRSSSGSLAVQEKQLLRSVETLLADAAKA